MLKILSSFQGRQVSVAELVGWFEFNLSLMVDREPDIGRKDDRSQKGAMEMLPM